MSVTLLEIEKEVLEEGREWTRRRLQERLQKAADAILPVCGQSGLVLKRQRKISIPLTTVSGLVRIDATRGHSSATGRWHCPVREQWGLANWARLSPELEQRLAYNAAVTGSFQKAAEHAQRWGSPISDDTIHALVGRVAERNKDLPLPAPPRPKPQEPPLKSDYHARRVVGAPARSELGCSVRNARSGKSLLEGGQKRDHLPT